jgi:hypothetical protein
MKRISPSYAITLEAVGSAAVVIFAIALFFASRVDKDEVCIIGGLLTLLVCIPGIIAATIVHYRCWKAIPAEIARTTPGRAVGLLFVPFFNFYWYFVSYAGLAEDCAEAQRSPRNHRGLGIALGILSITGWTFAAQGLLLIPLAIATFVVWLLFTLRMVAAANRLMDEASPGASGVAEPSHVETTSGTAPNAASEASRA